MISEEEIDAAIAILEDPKAGAFRKEMAAWIAEAYVRQEERTLDWMHQCYLSVGLARMAAERYGNRANRAGTG